MNDLSLPLLRENSQPRDTSGQMGRLLVESGKLRSSDLDRVLLFQKQRGLRFGEAAKSLGLITEDDIRSVLARQFSYPVVQKTGSRLHPALVAAHQPNNQHVEALRGLRSELMLRYFDNSYHRVLPLVSVDGGSATNELITNLAIVFSQLGTRTLLIDADLRAPSLHQMFGHANNRGLSDALAGRASVTPQSCEPFDSLWLLNGGTMAPNPQELLAHKRYQELMVELVGSFDVILVNTPALSESLDAQLIAARAGAALMVARENVTRLRRLEQASQRLREVGVAIMGVALSR